MSPDAPALILDGVAAGSPLLRLLSSRAPAGAVIAGGGGDPPAAAWRDRLAGTPLQWWSDAAENAPAPPTGAIRLDLFGRAASGEGPRWFLVDGEDRPALAPFAFLETVHRSPYVASLRLVARTTRPAQDHVLLAEAVLSSRQAYGALLLTIGDTAARILAGTLAAPDLGRLHPAAAPSAAPRAGSLGWRPARLRARLRTAKALWFSRFYEESWAIGVAGLTVPGLLDTIANNAGLDLPAAALGPTQWLETPSLDGYLADPFAHPERADEVLFEVFSNASGRGTLASAQLGPGMETRLAPLALGLDCHLSYPYAWREDGRVLCLPESGAARTTRIFELSGEDNQAREIARVCDGPAVADPSLFRHGGYYWIAYTDTDIGLHDNLCLLYSERLEGPWRQHPGNPVKWDVRSSRPGGTPFLHDGILYRPAQNCAATYGAALAINRVITCTPAAFLEETVAMILPDPAGPYPAGLHTLSVDAIGNRLLIDGKRYRLGLAAIARKLGRRLDRLRGRG